jgi:hypothetical protein
MTGGEPMRYKVETPYGGFTGERRGVYFVRGVAEIDDELLAKEFARNWGYKVTEIKEVNQAEKKATSKKSKK